jgi:hypothetical protein
MRNDRVGHRHDRLADLLECRGNRVDARLELNCCKSAAFALGAPAIAGGGGGGGGAKSGGGGGGGGRGAIAPSRSAPPKPAPAAPAPAPARAAPPALAPAAAPPPAPAPAAPAEKAAPPTLTERTGSSIPKEMPPGPPTGHTIERAREPVVPRDAGGGMESHGHHPAYREHMEERHDPSHPPRVHPRSLVK